MAYLLPLSAGSIMQIIKLPARARKSVSLPQPIPYPFRPVKKRLAIWDTETDPFAPGRVVAPFTCGLHFPDTGEYYDFWGDDCIAQFFEFLDANYSEEELVIYAHNGGNFDFYFAVDYFDEGMSPFIINGRLVQIYMRGQEFRDSYSLIPVPLGTYQKTHIDYSKFERPVREQHKAEIRAYQKDDCVFLGELVSRAHAMFGDKLTMASVALPMLRSYHGFETMTERTDEEMRPFYFGGRNQCFETGELSTSHGGKWKIFDVNSMYPDAMKRFKHPISATPHYESRITERTHFAKITAWSDGALPIRKDNDGLDFPRTQGTFFASIHEIRAGQETGTLKIIKVHHSIYFEHEASMGEFVDTFYNRRLECDAVGDDGGKLFNKLVPNSSYGKFAQDPRKYENYLFNQPTMPTPLMCESCRANEALKLPPCAKCESGETSSSGWYLHTQRGEIMIFARPQQRKGSHGFFNVATAASITGAARAQLLRGIAGATRPIYCDTDSLICEGLSGVTIDRRELGAWKLEAEGDTCCIAGKKLYAVFDNGEAIKQASKGVKLTADEIARVCRGETVEYANPVPKFSLMGQPSRNATQVTDKVTAEFVTRNIKRTG